MGFDCHRKDQLEVEPGGRGRMGCMDRQPLALVVDNLHKELVQKMDKKTWLVVEAQQVSAAVVAGPVAAGLAEDPDYNNPSHSTLDVFDATRGRSVALPRPSWLSFRVTRPPAYLEHAFIQPVSRTSFSHYWCCRRQLFRSTPAGNSRFPWNQAPIVKT